MRRRWRLHVPCGWVSAQLRGLLDVMVGAEFMWQWHADIGSDSAPIPFPVVGRLKDGTYLHEGRRYRH